MNNDSNLGYLPCGFSRQELAERIAKDIPEGAYVNLGIGAPALVSNFIPKDREVIFHVEHGLLGMGPEPAKEFIDPDIINAGKLPVTEILGAVYMHHADSFAMIRGGHLDICVLGAFQVSEKGDIANWHTGESESIPSVGGAMDLASGAKEVFVMMDLFAKDGRPKLVRNCTYPLTGSQCVTRIYTDYGVFSVIKEGIKLVESFTKLTKDDFGNLLGLIIS